MQHESPRVTKKNNTSVIYRFCYTSITHAHIIMYYNHNGPIAYHTYRLDHTTGPTVHLIHTAQMQSPRSWIPNSHRCYLQPHRLEQYVTQWIPGTQPSQSSYTSAAGQSPLALSPFPHAELPQPSHTSTQQYQWHTAFSHQSAHQMQFMLPDNTTHCL